MRATGRLGNASAFALPLGPSLHLKSEEVRPLAHRGEKDGKVSFWLQPKDYAVEAFREKWDRIGSGLSGEVVVVKPAS